jgi:hypothetical protein
MKVLFSALLALVLCISAASAELLTTANPIGQGKWAVLGTYISDANVANTSGYTMATLGGYVGYGAMDKLDLYLNVGSATVGGLPAGITASTTAIGLNAKYLVAAEGKDLPVSVSVGGGYKSINTKASAGAGGDTTGAQMSLAVGVSKIMAPFVPYGGLAYRSTSKGGSSNGSQIDLTIGSAIAWSAQGAVFVEGTYQMFSSVPISGNYNSNQIAIGVGYAL